MKEKYPQKRWALRSVGLMLYKDPLREISISGETENYVSLEGESRRVAKVSGHETVYKTYEEARLALIEKVEARLKIVRSEVKGLTVLRNKYKIKEEKK